MASDLFHGPCTHLIVDHCGAGSSEAGGGGGDRRADRSTDLEAQGVGGEHEQRHGNSVSDLGRRSGSSGRGEAWLRNRRGARPAVSLAPPFGFSMSKISSFLKVNAFCTALKSLANFLIPVGSNENT